MDNFVSIRGAATVKENNVKEIKNTTMELFSKIVKQNKIDKSKIINIVFTVTDDLDSVNPATVIRKEFKLDSIPMLCVQEMKVRNGLPKCIRVMIQTYHGNPNGIKHIYLGEAINLRPDLTV
ncbi:MAG: chorismate mutase [Candidatus Melainabacteria bacterium]|nr:chorismate mutase [Candidatus Melainabacteria bacterium]